MMPECRNCEATVSAVYARVMGDNRDRVHTCGNCANDLDERSHAGLDGGAA